MKAAKPPAVVTNLIILASPKEEVNGARPAIDWLQAQDERFDFQPMHPFAGGDVSMDTLIFGCAVTDLNAVTFVHTFVSAPWVERDEAHVLLRRNSLFEFYLITAKGDGVPIMKFCYDPQSLAEANAGNPIK